MIRPITRTVETNARLPIRSESGRAKPFHADPRSIA